MNLVTLSGSPSAKSRSAWLLRLAQERLPAAHDTEAHIDVRGLPAQALLRADAKHPELSHAIGQVTQADLLIVSTPIYKAAYSGLLKVFLDLLPPDVLRGKAVLPLATGGSPGHLLAIDYALKPVLASLGARHILDTVYVLDEHLRPHETLGYVPDDSVIERLDRALQGVSQAAVRRRTVPSALPSTVSTLVARFSG